MKVLSRWRLRPLLSSDNFLLIHQHWNTKTHNSSSEGDWESRSYSSRQHAAQIQDKPVIAGVNGYAWVHHTITQLCHQGKFQLLHPCYEQDGVCRFCAQRFYSTPVSSLPSITCDLDVQVRSEWGRTCSCADRRSDSLTPAVSSRMMVSVRGKLEEDEDSSSPSQIRWVACCRLNTHTQTYTYKPTHTGTQRNTERHTQMS